MEVVWTHRARQRLLEIYDYIARDQPQNARKWVNLLLDRGDGICKQPWIGRTVPEYADETVREIFEGDYRIIYQITSSRIHILTVRHGSKPLPMKLSNA